MVMTFPMHYKLFRCARCPAGRYCATSNPLFRHPDLADSGAACNATGSYQRIDTAYSRAFLAHFI
jgi:hypothetical protein